MLSLAKKRADRGRMEEGSVPPMGGLIDIAISQSTSPNQLALAGQLGGTRRLLLAATCGRNTTTHELIGLGRFQLEATRMMTEVEGVPFRGYFVWLVHDIFLTSWPKLGTCAMCEAERLTVIKA